MKRDAGGPDQVKFPELELQVRVTPIIGTSEAHRRRFSEPRSELRLTEAAGPLPVSAAWSDWPGPLRQRPGGSHGGRGGTGTQAAEASESDSESYSPDPGHRRPTRRRRPPESESAAPGRHGGSLTEGGRGARADSDCY